MQKRRPGQPGHQRGILHRVPSPVPPPPKHAISPVRSQKNPTRQKQPRHHRPAPRNVDPLLPRVPHHQRPQRKRKRHRKPHIPQVKHRRMDHHLRVLQQRIQPMPIRRQRPRLNRKRRSCEIQQHQKEDLHPSQNGRSKRRKPYIHPMPKTQHKPIRRQKPGPQHQRPFLPRPKRGKLVSRMKIPIRMLQNVRDREVIRKRRPSQRKRRASHHDEARHTRSPRRLP